MAKRHSSLHNSSLVDHVTPSTLRPFHRENCRLFLALYFRHHVHGADGRLEVPCIARASQRPGWTNHSLHGRLVAQHELSRRNDALRIVWRSQSDVGDLVRLRLHVGHRFRGAHEYEGVLAQQKVGLDRVQGPHLAGHSQDIQFNSAFPRHLRRFLAGKLLLLHAWWY